MFTTKQAIINWLDKYRITNYTINEDLSVDVDDSVYFYEINLKEPPFKFNIVKDDFYCGNNQLTSTEFFPKEVSGFYCYNNKFKNLDNFPKLAEGWIDIRKNPNLENIIGLWNCDYKGNTIFCDEKWKEEVECYLISIDRLKVVKIITH